MHSIWLLGVSVAIVHIGLSLIYLTIHYKKRMSYLRANPIARMRSWQAQVLHFALLLLVSLVFGSFLLFQKMYRLIKFKRKFGSLDSQTRNHSKK